MNRDELLDKLAMEMAEWPSVMTIKKDYEGWDWANGDHHPHLISHDKKLILTRDNWLQRRTELIKCPQDSEAPSWARWKAQDGDGEWYWFKSKPHKDHFQWGFHESGADSGRASIGKIPAGHRWRDTLTKVNQVPELNPEKSSLTDSQARELAIETGQCSDGTQCGMFAETAYCDDCPNQPPEADARMLDAQFAADIAAKRPNANSILNAAAHHMQERAATYDKPQGERSMAATIGAFNAITGHHLSEEQGWLFMQLLKTVRSQQGAYRADSYEDGAAYVALAGEAAAKERS